MAIIQVKCSSKVNTLFRWIITRSDYFYFSPQTWGDYSREGDYFREAVISNISHWKSGPKYISLRASSPVWASETGLARTREQVAKPQGVEERRACNHPLQLCICTSPRRREIPLAEK